MNKKIFIPFLGTALIAGFIIIASCTKEDAPAAAPKDYSFVQEFDSMEAMLNQGWVARNNSRPLGTSTWVTGQYGWDAKKGVSGYPGANTSHSGTDYVLCPFSAQGDPTPRNVSTGQIGRSSCWLISPAVPMKNGDKISFYTRTLEVPATFKDKMEFRVNYNNSSVEIGNDSSTVGDFTTLVTTVNGQFTASGYPDVWTKYEYTVVGSNVPKMGRFAFRYNTPDAGNAGANGQGVAVDEVVFESKRN
jgi:hypothetical protein